jgi:hypothetical protein
MKNYLSFAAVIAFSVSACGTGDVAAQPAPIPVQRQPFPAFPTLPVLPGQLSAAGSMPFGISGLVMRVKNNVEPRGLGLAEPTIVSDITIDNVPAPPSPIYGRSGIPLQEEDLVSVPSCPNPYNCEHVLRGIVWRTIATYGPGGIPVLMRAGVYGCLKQPFYAGDVIVSLDTSQIVPCAQKGQLVSTRPALTKHSSRSRRR